ncbi:MAG: lipopolysaccharide transport periplasmic protein LptA [Ectothiorhodospiraceae bacterium]|nr:lipopolysaccharide transport periplasmic protein LptA [Ectothiorhodospiraceae bacterium]MCH8504412.1 lipopolysaccharide transport periplasmic protein LptA [Ectothiorhodospiraceae bacterium]
MRGPGRHLAQTALLAVLVGASPLLQADASRQQPITLDADHAEIDNVTGISIYTGDVVLTQGLREITGDRMTVHTRSGGRELDHVVVEGAPAIYTQTPDGDGRVVRAEAPRMEYHAAGPERVILLEGGRLTQGRNEFTGETVHYNLETEVVNARGDQDTGRRIRITLFPDDEDE